MRAEDGEINVLDFGQMVTVSDSGQVDYAEFLEVAQRLNARALKAEALAENYRAAWESCRDRLKEVLREIS